jgi:hypothetical protein
MTSDGGCDAVGLSCLDEGDSFHIFLDMFEGGLEFQELSHIFVSCGGDLEEAIEKASAALLQVCEPPEQSPMREKVEEDAFPLEFHEPAFQEGLAQLVNTFSDFQVPTLAKVLLQCDGNAEVAAHELLNGIVEESERVGVASWSERVKENQKRASPSPSSRSRTAEAHEAAMHIRRILRPSSPPPSSSLNGEAVARRSRTRSCPALPSSSSLRHAAEEEGATMASLFHEASTKYKRSGGSSVVDLSRAGATSRQKMMMLHAMAAAAALQERNPRLRFAVPMDLDPSDGVKLSSLELLSWELGMHIIFDTCLLVTVETQRMTC